LAQFNISSLIGLLQPTPEKLPKDLPPSEEEARAKSGNSGNDVIEVLVGFWK